jgi:glycerophosphoryl diester phosphodiesterase
MAPTLFRPMSERPLVLGHRGASDEAPENTMAAFRLALEQGADGVELDVWRCRTGEVVVHHDEDARRTAGAPVRLRRAAWRELRRLDVGAWKATRFAGERMPLLREVLEELPGAIVNVELKSTGVPDLGLAQGAARAIRDAAAGERCIVSSFDYALLGAFRAVAPGVACGVLFGDDQRWRLRDLAGRLLHPAAVHPRYTLVTPGRARAWARRGVAVNAWTVDAAEDAARLCGLGVAAIITNTPGAVRDAVRRVTGR